MDQSLSSYRIFYEVARTENISRAAKELYISQPAISKSISKLEDSLNVPLFVRSSRGAQLTEEGRVLYEHVRAAFEQLDMGEQEIHRIPPGDRADPLRGQHDPLQVYSGSVSERFYPHESAYSDQY